MEKTQGTSTEYPWIPPSLLLIITNAIWITLVIRGPDVNMTLEQQLQLGTLALTATALFIAILYNIITINQSRKAALNQIRPRIVGNWSYIGPCDATFIIQNVGPGTACNLRGKIVTILKTKSEYKSAENIFNSILMTGEKFEFMLQSLNTTLIEDNIEKVTWNITCENVNGDTINESGELSTAGLSLLQEGIVQAWYDPHGIENLADQRNKLLSKIEDELGKMRAIQEAAKTKKMQAKSPKIDLKGVEISLDQMDV